MEIALHRAFDVCADPFLTLEQAVDLGFDTILTSGQAPTAWEGRDLLKELQKKSRGRIEILAASGIGPEPIRELIPYTGISSYHMSGKVTLQSPMRYRKAEVSMGLPSLSEYEIWQTSGEKVAEAVQALRGLD